MSRAVTDALFLQRTQPNVRRHLFPFISLKALHTIMAQPVRSVDRRFTTTAFEFPGYFIAQCHGVVRG